MKRALFFIALVFSSMGRAGANVSSPQVTINAITVVKDLPEKVVLNVEVDNRTDQPALVECFDTTHGLSTNYWMLTRASMQKGRHMYETSIGLNPEAAPDRHESDGIFCQVLVDNVEAAIPLAQKAIAFHKVWVWDPPNKIYAIRVARESGERLDLDVDYKYSGDHGDKDIKIDCQASTPQGYAQLAMWDGDVAIGAHTSHPYITPYVGEPPARVVTTHIACKMGANFGQDEFLSKTILYRKVWKPD